MLFLIKKNLINNLTVKIISLLLGYSCWYLITQSNTIALRLKVPLCFFNVPKDATLQAPETIAIMVEGKRKDFYALDFNNLAIHLDASLLHNGTNQLTFDASSLFLPEQIKLLHYSPLNPIVDVRIAS